MRAMESNGTMEGRNIGRGGRGAHDLAFRRTIDDDELEETTVSTQYPTLESRSTVRASPIIFIDRQEAEANRSQVDEIDSDITPYHAHYLADKHGLS
jgi:hypothetical protein